ncbi:MAG TPA: imidazolonepropionase [Baekduia sp.]|uniref:imidazolonepropionase n=1 Tax=Baekduia sp. TaxID=2600305 RepID=UPI002C35948D|nr:imidazolonepropionase [Baekduia sp.]HMJ36744.1 imidazolonepropionase [Baekduia sp.]
MTPLSIEGAAQVVRPPEDGLPYLRLDRAAQLRVEPGDVVADGGRIVGFEAAAAGVGVRRIDASGCAIVPGFVDAHTHLPFAGWRADEYAMKVAGRPYEEIARAGGGIAASARAFADAGDEEVLEQAELLAAEMLAHGTTTFEGKSGYGLSEAGELRALALAAELGERVVQTTTSTALLAHAVPPGRDADGWMDAVEALVPQTVATALDIYVESVAFGLEHLERMGAIAAANGRDLRAHVEQFSTMRSVPVALAAGARSVDHLACLHPDDLAPLAAAECAAVLLPAAELLGDERVAPGRALADAGAIGVLATDANPGTSPVVSLPLIVGLAVRRYRWTVREALAAITLNAAWVLRLDGELGSLEVGKRADVVLLDAPIEHVPYRLGHNPVALVVAGGEVVHVRPDQAWRVPA